MLGVGSLLPREPVLESDLYEVSPLGVITHKLENTCEGNALENFNGYNHEARAGCVGGSDRVDPVVGDEPGAARRERDTPDQLQDPRSRRRGRRDDGDGVAVMRGVLKSRRRRRATTLLRRWTARDPPPPAAAVTAAISPPTHALARATSARPGARRHARQAALQRVDAHVQSEPRLRHGRVVGALDVGVQCGGPLDGRVRRRSERLIRRRGGNESSYINDIYMWLLTCGFRTPGRQTFPHRFRRPAISARIT